MDHSSEVCMTGTSSSYITQSKSFSINDTYPYIPPNPPPSPNHTPPHTPLTPPNPPHKPPELGPEGDDEVSPEVSDSDSFSQVLRVSEERETVEGDRGLGDSNSSFKSVSLEQSLENIAYSRVECLKDFRRGSVFVHFISDRPSNQPEAKIEREKVEKTAGKDEAGGKRGGEAYRRDVWVWPPYDEAPT
eukprot:18843-Amorphochlora_amoeboformis.AAC.1